MSWAYDWHEKYSNGFYDKLLAENKLSAKSIKPNVYGLDFYIDAFSELGTCRNNGGPIPFTAIADYCKIYNVAKDTEEFSDFVYLIRRMDDALLAKEKSKNERTNTNTSNNSQGGHARGRRT